MTFRRLSLAALLVALALPASALAQSRGSRVTSSRPAAGTSLGALLGFEFEDGTSGLSIRGDGVLDQRWIAPNVLLSGVLSLGYSHFGDDYYEAFSRYGWEWSQDLFKIIPAARFTFAVAPQVGLYADAGLGLYVSSWSQDWNNSPYADVDDTDLGVAMRLGGGAFFDVSPTVRLGGEFAVNPYIGGSADTTVSLMAAAIFRL